MRKVVPVLGVGAVVALAGAAIAGATLAPVVAVFAGVLLFATAIALRTSPAPLAWIAACLFVLTIQWNGIRLGGGSFANVFMAAAFASMVAHAVLARRPVAAPPMLLLCALGFLLATLISLIFPPNVHLSNITDVNIFVLTPTPVYITHRSDLFTLAEVELSFIVTPLVIIFACTTVRRCVTLMDLWTLGAVVSAFVGLTDTLGIVHLSPYPLSSGTRSSGLTIHPNYLALGACMAIPTAMLWLGRSLRWQLAGVVAVFTLLGGAYASGSRAGAVTGLAAVVVTAILIPRLRRLALQAAPFVGMAAIGVLFFTKTGDHILSQVRLGGGGVDLTITGSNAQRSRAAHAAWEQFRTRPIQGVGFSVIQDAHSIYLQLLAATGVIGLASFFAFCGGIAAAVRRGLQGPLRNEVTAAGLSVSVWLLNGIVDNQLGDKYLYVVPGLLFAMARVTRMVQARKVPEATGALPGEARRMPAGPGILADAPAPALVT